jgi:hypothetical protein
MSFSRVSDGMGDVGNFVNLFWVLAPSETPMKQEQNRFHPS